MSKFYCECCKRSFSYVIESDGFDICSECLNRCLICGDNLNEGEINFCLQCCTDWEIQRGKQCKRIKYGDNLED